MADIDFQPLESSPIDFQPMDSDIGKAESFGRGALNNFPMAKQATAAIESGPYSQNLANLSSKAQAAKAANPISYGAGAVTGAAAPLAIPGIGEALEAAPVAGNAALGALQGISDVDLSKDRGEALKQAAIGAGIGGTVGKVGEELLGGAPKKLVSVANKQAVKTAGLKGLGHLEPEEIQDLGEFMNKNDLINGPTEARLGKAGMLQNQYGKQIETLKQGAPAVQPGQLNEFTDPLQEKAASLSKLYAPEAKSDANWYMNGVRDLQQNGNDMEGLQRLKNYYGDKAFNGDHTVKNKAAADVYGAIKDSMTSLLKSSPEEYQEAMTNYSRTSDIVNGLTKKLETERGGGSQGGGGFGMMGAIRRLPGPVRAVAGTIGALSGHPIIPVAAALPELTNPAIHSAVLRGTANNLPRMTQAANQSMIDYLNSKYGASNAQ